MSANKIQHPKISYFQLIDTMPICDVFNVNGCEVARTIEGTIYKDDNGDCTKEPSGTKSLSM